MTTRAAGTTAPALSGPAPSSTPATTGGDRSAFRPDIEGLRAVAVTLVVGYHAWPAAVPGGFVGVDVFFVISGFLITGHLLADRSSKGHLDFARFYARRVRRILPASTLVLIVTVVVAWQVLPAFRAQSVSTDSIWASAFAINYHLAIEGSIYLNASAPVSPLQNYWSLSVEEQFYAVWPLLLLAASLVWVRRSEGSARSVSEPARRVELWAVLVVIFVGSLAVDLRLTNNSPSWAYYSLLSRGWELAAGALLAVAAPHLVGLARRRAALVAWAGLAAIVVAALAFGAQTPYPGTAALLPVAGAVAVIAGGTASAARRPGTGNPLLGLRPFQAVGRLSYSWYLWHFPALILAPSILGVAALSVGGNLAVAAVSLGIAAVAYRVVEQPVRSSRVLVQRPWTGLLLGGALIAAAVAVAIIVPRLHPQPGAASTGSELPSPQTTAQAQAVLARALQTRTIPAGLHPSLATATADQPVIYGDGCHLGVAAVTGPPCVFGDRSSPVTVVLFGDSHAAQWFPALESISNREGWRLVSMTKSSCPVADVSVYNTYLKRTYTECDTWRANAERAIARLHPAMVVVSERRDWGRTANPDDSASFVRPWAEGVRSTLGRLVADGTRVVLVADTPHVETSVPLCLSEALVPVASCGPTVADTDYDAARKRADRQAAATAGATYVDPTPWICTPSGCPPIVGNLLVYRDEQHLTVEYSTWIAPLLERELVAVLVGHR